MARIILIFILIYLIFRILTAWIFPRIVRWYVERYKKRFYEQNPAARSAGEKKEKPLSDQIGEYVDYEEIKEKDKK